MIGRACPRVGDRDKQPLRELSMSLRTHALSLACSGVLAACSNGDVVQLPSFGNISDAPPSIQSAAQAVVRIRTAGAYATGSFISPDGILLTNNHVLGVDVCPQEGCYAQVSFMHQLHADPQDPQTVFFVPLAVDVGLDVAVLQAYAAPGSASLNTPHYLTLASHDAGSLRGMHVYVVGHPEGRLKKWTQGQIVDSDGAWVTLTAYSLPGSSGSPILDEQGHAVAILHRGPSAQDLISNRGVNEYSVGSASASVIQALSAPLPPAMVSVRASSSDADVVHHQLVYLNAREENATVNGSPTPVLSILGDACDTGLAQTAFASPDDLGAAVDPCVQAVLWIECRSDEMMTVSTGFGVCPPAADAWQSRYKNVYDHWVALNGQLMLDMVSFGPAALAHSKAEGTASGAEKLGAALQFSGPPLDFNIAAYLAAFNIDSYGGTRIVDFLHGYAKSPGYALSGEDIAATALWLSQNGQLSGPDTVSFLKTLAGDEHLDIGAKLFIENVLYQSHALD
jgi:hypothetical protein